MSEENQCDHLFVGIGLRPKFFRCINCGLGQAKSVNEPDGTQLSYNSVISAWSETDEDASTLGAFLAGVRWAEKMHEIGGDDT
jgi:hypothetical protein